MDKTWIVVAHQAGARIFRRNRPKDGLELVHEIDHPEGRLRNHDINADRPGRNYSPADASRHGLSAPNDPDEQEAENFAVEINRVLEDGRTHNRFEYLILVAGPQFLGKIKGHLSKPLEARIVATLSKNLGNFDSRELPDHLDEVLKTMDQDVSLGRTA